MKAIRHEADLTQKQLAERTGLHDTYISQIENGVGNPAWTHAQPAMQRARGAEVVLVKRVDELGRE